MIYYLYDYTRNNKGNRRVATKDQGDITDTLREELARYAENKNRRPIARPHRWCPHTVENPPTGLPFTDAGAWALIADLLRNGEPIEVIKLDEPPGQLAYVMKHSIQEGKPRLYIKIHFGNGCVIGRSFHYSEHN